MTNKLTRDTRSHCRNRVLACCSHRLWKHIAIFINTMTECHAPGIKGQSCKGFILGKKKLNGKKKPQHHWLNQVGRIHSVSSLIICSSVVKCDVRPYLHGPENHQGWRLHSFFGHLVQLLEYPHSGEKGMKDEYITDRSEKIKEGKINQ